MSGWWRRWRELFQPRQIDHESVVELEQHVALAAADKVRAHVAEPRPTACHDALAS